MWYCEEPILAAIIGTLDMYKSSLLYKDLLSITTPAIADDVLPTLSPELLKKAARFSLAVDTVSPAASSFLWGVVNHVLNVRPPPIRSITRLTIFRRSLHNLQSTSTCLKPYQQSSHFCIHSSQ
jgi:hypothetical protein